MAKRPIYLPQKCGDAFVRTEYVEFIWHPGMAMVQKQKSIQSFHAAAITQGICRKPLEISSKSEQLLGVKLSAFNLKVTTQKKKQTFTVESAYQSSKVFEQGGPYKDLLYAESLKAKKDERLQGSGRLVEFDFFGDKWPLEPRTAFYDWVYINALYKNEWAFSDLNEFDAFTDIEFNPEKSINCQAYSAALFSALSCRGLIQDAIKSKESYLRIIDSKPVSSSSENTIIQPRLV